MKIGILILAHKNAEQLNRLIRRLKSDFKIFVHLDRNSDLFGKVCDEENVVILKHSYAAYWGSRSAILAVISLLKEAHKCSLDQYILISGQDLPIKENSDIKFFFQKSPGDYIAYKKLPNEDWGIDGGVGRISLYWETKYGRNAVAKTMYVPIRVFFLMVRYFQTIFKIKRKIDFPLFGGALWFNLSNDAVDYILKFLNENPWYLKRFAFTRCADEIFFQTILLGFNYKNKERIISDELRYIDWETGPTYPRILEARDIEKCIMSDALFARKFDLTRDPRPVDYFLSDLE